VRTAIKNRIAAVISKSGLRPPTKTAVGVNSRRYLSPAAGRPCYRLELDGYLRLLDHLTEEIRRVTEAITPQVIGDPQAQLLCTMPGVGAYSALLILSEIVVALDPGRTLSARHQRGPAVSEPLLSGLEKARRQYRTRGGGASDVANDLRNADQAGSVSPDETGDGRR